MTRASSCSSSPASHFVKKNPLRSGDYVPNLEGEVDTELAQGEPQQVGTPGRSTVPKLQSLSENNVLVFDQHLGSAIVPDSACLSEAFSQRQGILFLDLDSDHATKPWLGESEILRHYCRLGI
ncbi:hypothetical protein M378DRAFT_156590 [Amanita muscaria Koide BX008]|uniref:Uncharacterized protein n=1 Tax=Amanita muscaria (strain Koide BX008) TaxID=946122 RepID=A0A0C2T3J6_AMAMK|nr:hypothetical protein M378DRAFT_156590 [Amanita muscaria Koide BX008]